MIVGAMCKAEDTYIILSVGRILKENMGKILINRIVNV